jgi:hypothetical protein
MQNLAGSMTRPKLLALNDQQMSDVLEGAKLVPPPWRGRYLEAIADRLLPFDDITDDDVNSAILRSSTA